MRSDPALDLIGAYGKQELATVYIAAVRGDHDKVVEFVESCQPPLPRSEKWVLIVSTMLGCPVGCSMCDAGGEYRGRLTADEILAQVRFLIHQRYPDGKVPAPKFKIQFARMGEPAMNPAVLTVLDQLPDQPTLELPGLLPSISTIAPRAAAPAFFDRLIAIKDRHYRGGRFQLQFSIHSTDTRARDRLIPIRKWDLAEIAAYGRQFYRTGDRKIALNFAAAQEHAIDPAVVAEQFDPDRFIIKLTPLNPTAQVGRNQLRSWIDPDDEASYRALVAGFESYGFDVIVSIGELEENRIGSNCGQFVTDTKARRGAAGSNQCAPAGDEWGGINGGYRSEDYKLLGVLLPQDRPPLVQRTGAHRPATARPKHASVLWERLSLPERANTGERHKPEGAKPWPKHDGHNDRAAEPDTEPKTDDIDNRAGIERHSE